MIAALAGQNDIPDPIHPMRLRWFALLPLLLLPAALHGQEGGDDGYRLVWADEFDNPGVPDPEKWTYERGFVRNRELQWYQPENARIGDGMMVIEARRESRPNPMHEAGSERWNRARETIEYTSASVTTRGLHDWLYGRFEMRARIDVRPGMWPAFWALGTSGGWPANGEIDIMEYYRGMILANVAWAKENRSTAFWDDVKIPLAEFGEGWADEFHVWRMDWTPEAIELYLDDRLLNRTDLSETINYDGRNPFHEPQYIILNLAVGGTNGGDPSATGFPGRYEIDYVRIYQK